MTGSFVRQFPLIPGDTAIAEFSGIGRVVNGTQRIEAATKEMGFAVLATAAVAEAAPEAWIPAGTRRLADFQHELELFTYPAAGAQGQSAAE